MCTMGYHLLTMLLGDLCCALGSQNTVEGKCDQCDQMEHIGYPESINGEVSSTQKSFFLAVNKFDKCGVEYLLV